MVATLVDEVRSESRQANISHAGSAQKKLQSREKKESNQILAEAC
jgi:DNA topoisomerase-3